jgi:hypothetical protein
MLLTQINKKIEQLESIVKSALQEIKEDQLPAPVPKVTNYFCTHSPSLNAQHQFEEQPEEVQSQ